jgi:hypothetical protein
MPKIERTVAVAKPLDVVWAYLTDFTQRGVGATHRDAQRVSGAAPSDRGTRSRSADGRRPRHDGGGCDNVPAGANWLRFGMRSRLSSYRSRS